MAESSVERRLAAILVADVVGYSKLMGVDEEGTLAALKRHRGELIDAAIDGHRGRIVKTTGDGLLVEFASVVDAVRCAVEVQRGMAGRNAETPDDRRIDFRIGINLGDVIVEDGDIFGDGVNVAARLEGLAEPGGICVSGKVHDEVKARIDVAFDDLGPQQVKNIAEPVPTFRVLLDGGARRGPVDVSKPVPGFDGRPAIAVLPFENMSADPEQEYFADGIAEDILTRLATLRWLPVIARNSTFVYKGRAVDVKEVGATLGARYVLEGSVRKAANRVRITGQLIAAETGHHVWAERYDRVLDDIFELQDEITDSIVSALEPAVGKAEMVRATRKPTENLDAWDLYQRGMWHFLKLTKEDFAAALETFERAAKLDPEFAGPPSGISGIRMVSALLSWAENPAEALGESLRHAQAAIALDPLDALANTMLSYAHGFTRHYDEAIAAANRALEVNPSFAMACHALGFAHMIDGNAESAVEAIERALRISPRDSWFHVWVGTLSAANYMARNYDAALEFARIAVRLAPHFPIAQRTLASALAQLGRLDEAREALDAFLTLSPDYTLGTARHAVPFRSDEDFEHYIEGLRIAGWKG